MNRYSSFPQWNNLPFDCQELTYRMLDYPTQCAMSKAAQEPRRVLASIPHRSKLMVVSPCVTRNVRRTYFEIRNTGRSATLDEWEQEKRAMARRMSKHTYFSYHVMNDFMMVFKHPGSVVEQLWFREFHRSAGKVLHYQWPEFEHFFTTLLTVIENTPGFQMRVEQLYWPFIDDDADQYVVRFLSFVKPSDLKRFVFCRLRYARFLPDVQALISLPQWDSLKEIVIKHNTMIPIEAFFNAEKILAVGQPIAEEAWKLIKNFRSKTRPVGSFFIVTVNCTHETLLNFFDFTPIHQPNLVPDEGRGYSCAFVQLLPLACSEMNLLLMISDSRHTGELLVHGIVCNPQNLVEDHNSVFRSDLYKMWVDETLFHG